MPGAQQGFGLVAAALLDLFYLCPAWPVLPRPVFAMGREYPMKTGQMDAWFGYQGSQLGDEIQWFEYHMSGVIVVRRFQLIAHFAIPGQGPNPPKCVGLLWHLTLTHNFSGT